MDPLLSGMNFVLAGAIYVLVMLIKQIPHISDTTWGQRLLPVIPLVLGVLGGLVGAVTVDPSNLVNRIVAGIMVGGVSMAIFKVGKTTVLGQDVGPSPEAPQLNAPPNIPPSIPPSSPNPPVHQPPIVKE